MSEIHNSIHNVSYFLVGLFQKTQEWGESLFHFMSFGRNLLLKGNDPEWVETIFPRSGFGDINL